MLPRPSAVVRHMQTTQSGLAAVARHFPDVSFPLLFLAPQKNEHENRLTVKCAFLLFVLFFGGVLVPPLFPATAWEEGEVDVSCFFLWQSPLREHTRRPSRGEASLRTGRWCYSGGSRRGRCLRSRDDGPSNGTCRRRQLTVTQSQLLPEVVHQAFPLAVGDRGADGLGYSHDAGKGARSINFTYCGHRPIEQKYRQRQSAVSPSPSNAPRNKSVTSPPRCAWPPRNESRGFALLCWNATCGGFSNHSADLIGPVMIVASITRAREWCVIPIPGTSEAECQWDSLFQPHGVFHQQQSIKSSR